MFRKCFSCHLFFSCLWQQKKRMWKHSNSRVRARYDNGCEVLALLLLTTCHHLLHFLCNLPNITLTFIRNWPLSDKAGVWPQHYQTRDLFLTIRTWFQTLMKLSKISLMFQITAILAPSSTAVVAQITRAVNSPILCLCTAQDHVHEKSTVFLSSLWKTPSRMECADSIGFSGRSHVWTSLTESSVHHSRFPFCLDALVSKVTCKNTDGSQT